MRAELISSVAKTGQRNAIVLPSATIYVMRLNKTHTPLSITDCLKPQLTNIAENLAPVNQRTE